MNHELGCIWLQKSAAIQPKTSLSKFADSCIHQTHPAIGIPLWVRRATEAPRSRRARGGATQATFVLTQSILLSTIWQTSNDSSSEGRNTGSSCIEAKLGNQILFGIAICFEKKIKKKRHGKLSPRSTQCTPLHFSKITFFIKNC